MAGLQPFAESRKARIATSLKPSRKGFPRIMAVINCTPDSFYSSSRAETEKNAIELCTKALSSGADWIDIGGESTRPGASEVSTEEEIRRVIPVIGGLREASPDALISIDTRNVTVAQAALAAGADLVNDVSGLRDAAMVELVLNSGCGVCIMHMQGEPGQMQEDPEYGDVVLEVSESLLASAQLLVGRGHPPELICLDPGIGFGKRLQHNLDLLRNTSPLRGEDGFSVVLGASRKSLFRDLLGREHASQRLSGTLAVAAFASDAGIDILRVHDVEEHIDLLKTLEELRR
jgi:dihydropteroate synthase